MNNTMKITVDTHLSDLLTGYPFLKKALPQINPRFKLLHTPLGKVMLKKATIAEMSRRSGMDAKTLIHAIEKNIRHAKSATE